MLRETAGHPHGDIRLSQRELEVLDLAAKGCTDKEISKELGIGVGTVNTYWTRIRGKLGTSSRAEAIALVERQRANYSLDLKDRENRLLAAEVTARREAERKLTETERLLREANARLEARVEARTKELEEAMRALRREVERRSLVEERLDSAQRIARIASWEINVQTRECFWSKHMYEIYGETPETFPLNETSVRNRLSPELLDLLDRPHPLEEGLGEDELWAFRLIRASVMTFVDPEFWEKALAQTRPLFDAPRTTEFDLRLLRRGQPHVHVNGVPQSEFDENGKLRILRGVIVDVTEAFESGRILRDAERMIQIVLQNAAVGLVLLDPSGHVRFLAGRAVEGLDLPTLGGRSWFDAFDEPTVARELLDRATKGETVIETVPLRGRHFLQVMIPDVDPTGDITGVITVLTDISEKHRARAKLDQAQARYRALTQLLEHPVCRLDPELVVIEANEAFRALVEGGRQPVAGSHLSNFVASEDAERLEAALRSLTVEEPQARWVTEVAIGEAVRMTVEWKTLAIFGGDGAVAEYLLVGRLVENPDPSAPRFESGSGVVPDAR
jgi:DNA-binding CsgD family transcriptional regulator